MRQARKILFSLICLFSAVAVILPTTIFGWFRIKNVIKLNSTGKSIIRYFESGTGEAGDPYIISNSTHLYNFAWLQVLGMLQDKKYYFKLNNDIDMQGEAIPPIGTDKYPFIGDFNGNNYVIENLVVSNNISELQTHFNTGILVLDNYVGFFGKIDLDENEATYTKEKAGRAHDFYLKDVSISTTSIGGGNVTMGIVAGHNNGSLENIGVSNNAFRVTAGNQVQSRYTLIGEIGDDSLWSDFPVIGAGNQIMVNPNDLPFTGNLLPNGNNQSYYEVSNSVPGHAYYTSTLIVDEVKFNSAIYKVNTPEQDRGKDLITATGNSVAFNKANSPDLADFYDNYYNNSALNKINYIIPSGVPSYNNLIPGLNIPYNGIWFKPTINDRSSIVFARTNMGDSAVIAVYEYKRNAGGTIDVDSWREIRFDVSIGNNKDVFCFDFDVKKDYEYIIGRPSVGGNDTVGFLYLILGGAGVEGTRMGEVNKVDYVLANTKPLSQGNYLLTNTHLSISGTVADAGNSYLIYVNKAEYEIEQGQLLTAVYYYYPDSSGVIVEENIAQGYESYKLSDYIADIFATVSPP